jgi:ABC-type multidrug transport system ATPase subunit
MIIKFSNVGKNYYGSWLFRGFNYTFQLNPGSSYVILGNNGSGKSTLARMLCGQVSPTEGEVSILNEDNVETKTSEVHHLYSLSSPAMELPEEFTVKEWYEFMGKTKGFDSTVDLTTLQEYCKFSNKAINKPLYTFSSGMKQRVKLYGAFLTNVSLVILDEPLSNLDKNGSDLYNKLWSQCHDKKAIVVASNDEKEYQKVSRRLRIEAKQIITE